MPAMTGQVAGYVTRGAGHDGRDPTREGPATEPARPGNGRAANPRRPDPPFFSSQLEFECLTQMYLFHFCPENHGYVLEMKYEREV